MQVGFSVVSRDEGVEFRTFGWKDRGPDSLISVCRVGGHAAVLFGRLYYRDALAGGLLPWPSGEAPSEETSEAALALAVYRRHGSAGLERLEGDFALVIWDTDARRLVACRDPLGGYPLFWVADGRSCAFATGLRPLLDLLPRRLLNLEYLADLLMVPGPVNEREGEACAYQGIRRVLAGSVVVAHLDSGRVERRIFWDWLERCDDPGTDRLAAISERYGGLLREAVRQRIRGRTAAHLSGGMDSTAVALLARDLIASGAGEAPLRTLSLVYEELPGLAREAPYLEEVLRREEGIEAHKIPADDLLDFDSFVEPPAHDEPYVSLWRLGMDRATVRAAAALGAATMLTGIGADELLDIQPFYLGDLLRRGRLLTAWTESARWARHDNCSRWGILYPFGIANLVPGWTERGLGGFLPLPGRSHHTEQGDWSVSPWIRPEFARRYALQRRAKVNARRTYRSSAETVLSFAVDSIKSRTGDVTRWCVAAPLGIAVVHPFLDLRVLRFGLGMQTRLKPEPGRMKPVLAEAMRDVLPEQIRNRPRKGAFNEVYYHGLSRNLLRLEDMVRRASIDDLGIINKEVLVQCLHEAALGGAHVRQLHRLNLTLSLVKWLTIQEEWQSTALPAADAVWVAGRDAAPGRPGLSRPRPLPASA